MEYYFPSYPPFPVTRTVQSPGSALAPTSKTEPHAAEGRMQMSCGHMMYLESINLEKTEGDFYLQSNVLSCEGIVLCDYTEEENAEEGGGGLVSDETSPARCSSSRYLFC